MITETRAVAPILYAPAAGLYNIRRMGHGPNFKSVTEKGEGVKTLAELIKRGDRAYAYRGYFTCTKAEWKTIKAAIKKVMAVEAAPKQINKSDYACKGFRVYSRDGKMVGHLTGLKRACTMEGCLSKQMQVLWSDGNKTWPCTNGMNLRKSSWRIA